MAAEEEIQLTLLLRDQMTAQLHDIQYELDQLHTKLRQTTDGTSSGTERDIQKLTDQIRIAEDQSRIAAMSIDKLDRHINELGDEASRTSGKLDKMGTATGKTSKGLSGVMAFGRGAAASVTAAAVAATAAVVGFVKLNGAVAQYQQNVNKSKAVFSSQIGQMRKWARAHRDDFGGSTQDVLTYAASLQDLIVPMGFSRKQATGMTKDIGSLVPVLTEWDKSGRSASEITDILAAALTGERESLKSLGVTISQDMVNAQVKLMRSQGKLKGASDEQAQAQATLALLYAKTGDAQKAYADNSDTLVRKNRNVTSQIKQLRDNGLEVLLNVWNRVTQAFNDAGFGDGLKAVVKWMHRNENGITSWLLNFASGLIRLGGWFLKVSSMAQTGFQAIIEVIAGALRFAAYLDPSLDGVADKAAKFADATRIMGDKQAAAAEKAFELADKLHEQADAAGNAQGAIDVYKRAVKQATSAQKDFLKQFKDTSLVTGYSSYRSPTGDNGDTASPWGGPKLGPTGLAAAHAHYATGRGMHITSGVRGFNLGSPLSDHRFGRAMDVRGPFLGAYAARVRESGGYAAMHGVGAGRHLHVAPRGTPQPTGGDTTVYDIDVHTGGGPVRPFDVRTAVTGAIREADRRRRERGGR